jgi:hypothetical protein
MLCIFVFEIIHSYIQRLYSLLISLWTKTIAFLGPLDKCLLSKQIWYLNKMYLNKNVPVLDFFC